MAEIKRRSPVHFKTSALKVDLRDNWKVALEYDEEGPGPWVVDLSHKTRWDLQDNQIGDQRPCDLTVPAPGACTFAQNTLINRMNRTQASIYHLGIGAPAMPDFSGYTDVTESTLFLALFGPQTFFLAEKLTSLNFMDPARKAPFLYQGPFCHVPCQIVTLQKNEDYSGGFLLTCSRGYGDSMIHAVMQSGAEFGLRPAGENRFQAWIEGLQA
jgi:hypothetical protein